MLKSILEKIYLDYISDAASRIGHQKYLIFRDFPFEDFRYADWSADWNC